jgi:hypothetical protein
MADAKGVVSHSGCVGFGLERIALALIRHHGFNAQAWPRDVRALLWGDTQRTLHTRWLAVAARPRRRRSERQRYERGRPE